MTNFRNRFRSWQQWGECLYRRGISMPPPSPWWVFFGILIVAVTI